MTTTTAMHLDQAFNRLDGVDRTVLEISFKAQRLPWLIALAFLGVFGFVYSIGTAAILYFLRLRMRDLNYKAIKLIDRILITDAMEMHLEAEAFSKKLLHVQGLTSRETMFRPITRQLDLMYKDNKAYEQAMFNRAYPDYHKPLSKEEHNRIFDAMRGWREDEEVNAETY